MRRQDYPIEYDSKSRIYRYADRVYNLPSIQINQGDLLALGLARLGAAQTPWPSFHRRLRKIHRLLLSGARDQDKAPSLDSGGVKFSFHRVGIGFVDPATLERLNEAVSHCYEVEFDYRKPADRRVKRHRVRPYFISERDNLLYLIAEEEGYAAPKTFGIPRIRGPVHITGTRFVRTELISLKKHFGHSFRSFCGQSLHHIKLRISARCAPYIKERQWHASQVITDLSGGEILFEMDISDIRDVHGWILRWGADLEVLEPAELRDAIAETAQKMGHIYK
jgi:predicted DNA-binding transcriptional regulator YafY